MCAWVSICAREVTEDKLAGAFATSAGFSDRFTSAGCFFGLKTSARVRTAVPSLTTDLPSSKASLAIEEVADIVRESDRLDSTENSEALDSWEISRRRGKWRVVFVDVFD